MQEGTLLRNNYRLDRLLGRGGMAEVYLAFDMRRQVRVAVKILREDLAEDPEFVRRFTREAEALARLDHPNIVRFYSFERQGAVAFIVMDFVPGTTLQRRLAELGGPLPLGEVSTILHQVGAALQYAHSEGYIHRDIKPGNIMLRDDGNALLSDFGIARAAESATLATVAVGTPAYMSPEQILGRPIDRRADIYSLGAVLFEMCTGRRPFSGSEAGLTETNTLSRLREAHLRLPPPDPRTLNPSLPAGAAQVILRALAKDPAQRWPDVPTLVQAWEAAVPPPRPDRLGRDGLAESSDGRGSPSAASRTTVPLTGPTPQSLTAQPAGIGTSVGLGDAARALGWRLWAVLGGMAVVAVAAILLIAAGSQAHRGAAPAAATPTEARTSAPAPAAMARASASPSPSPRVVVAESPTPRVTTSPSASRPTLVPSPAPATAAPATATLAPTRSPASTQTRAYTADFSAASSEWEEAAEDDMTRSLEGGKYHITVLTTEMTAWGHPGQDFSDFTLEVEASQVAGPNDNGYGVLLRYVDGDNFYYFEISGDGYWEFSKQEDGEWTTLVKWAETDAIRQGAATNQIKVVCDAGAFTFYVNAVRVGEFFDATFDEGDIGLAASSYTDAGVHVSFDNLKVQPLR